ncbi:MAG: hypothetical protein NT159_12635 [Proteobacteria bacterium]|nr:hypothetical protein [Pseudomonadota bacterium]
MDIPFAIRSVQAVSATDTVSTLSSLDQGSKLVPDANSLYATPSVTVTLGAVSPVPLTYNAAGMFDATSTLKSVLVANATAVATSVTPGPAAEAISPINESADTASTSTTASVAEKVGDTAPLPSGPTVNLVADFAAQAQDGIATNPAYANIATALYLNAAIFRSQHDSDVALPNFARRVQPVQAVPVANRI